MASVKIVLRNEEKADGTYPLAIRVTKDRKSSFIYLDYSIKPSEWDKNQQRVKRACPNHVRLNNYLIKKLSEATDKALELETNKADVSVKAVRNTVKPKTVPSFFPQAQAYLEALHKTGKYNEYTASKSRIGHFKQFLKNQDVTFKEVTVGCLDNFVVYLRSYTKKNKADKPKKMSERSVMNHLSAIRSVFAYARRQGVIDESVKPFGKGKVTIRFPDSKKEGLNVEEVERLENVELSDPRHKHAASLFLFSLYFAGMRVSDVFRLKWTDFRDGRLYYNMNKNNKGDSLKVPAKAQAILDEYQHYKETDDDLVFPELKGVDLTDEFVVGRTIAFKTSAIDKMLRVHVASAAKITKKLTMHIARHTFGNLSGNKIPIKTLQKLYRHTHLSTTANYQQNFDHDEADNALDTVINGSRANVPKPI